MLECKDNKLKVLECKDIELKMQESKVSINSKQDKLKNQSSDTTWCELILDIFIYGDTFT